MNYELFIAKRIMYAKKYKNSISAPIIKIAITAITLGIVIMLIATTTSKGLQLKIRDKIAGFNGHIQITNFDTNNSNLSITPIDKNQDFYPKFKNINGVKNVQIYATKAGIIRTKTSFEGIIFKGVSTDYDWSFFKEYLVEGKIPSFSNAINREVLLSKTIVNRLKLHLNDTILTTFIKSEQSKLPSNRKYIVVGIYDTGYADFDKNMMIGDIQEVQNLNNWTGNQIGGFEVLLDNFDEMVPKTIEIYKQIGATLNAVSILENFPAIFEWINLFDNNVLFIVIIMIFVAGVNMITALIVLILEKVQLIGILKALGSSNSSIRKIFIYNATYLIFKGLLFGNLIALLLIGLQYFFKIIKLDPQTYYVNEVPVYLDIKIWLLINVGTIVLCIVMLLIPSVIISKIQPSKSIKFA